MRAPIAAVCAGAALAGAALAGCGGDDAGPRRTVTAAVAQITIDEPVDGQALRGREQKDGRLRLRVLVRGRARPAAPSSSARAARRGPARRRRPSTGVGAGRRPWSCARAARAAS